MKKTLKKVIALALSLLLAGVFFACKEETIGEKATWYMISHYDAALSNEYYNYAYNDKDKMFKDVYVLGDISGALSYIEGVGTVATLYDDDSHPWLLVFTRADAPAPYRSVEYNRLIAGGQYIGGSAGVPIILVKEYFANYTTGVKQTGIIDPTVDNYVETVDTTPPESAAETETKAESENAENKSLDIPADIPDENKAAYLVYTDFKTQTYTGTGDDVIYITTPNDGTLWVLYVKGNAEGGYFGVTGYTGQREYTQLFVNTTEPYEGTLIDVTQDTLRLEIEASCDWQIEVRSIMSCPVVRKGDAYAESGDQVLIVKNSPDTADISGNPGENYFGVHAYGAYGYDLLVNTTDAYNGKVLLDPDIACIVVTAVGDWTIKLN